MRTEDPFKQLEPPRGGTQRFRARLDAAARQRFGPTGARVRLAVVLGAVAVVGVFVYSMRPTVSPPAEYSTEIYDAPEFDRLLGRAPQPLELRVERNAEAAAVEEIATSNPRIRLYALN